MKQEGDWFKSKHSFTEHSKFPYLSPMVGVKASSTSRLRKRRQIYDQQVYKQILKGLERKITSKNPNPMTAEAGIVQGKWSAMKGQAHMLHI